MSDIQRYEGKEITIIFDPARCIHSARCVNGLPRVFMANRSGPWIDPQGAAAEEIAALIGHCPSGALRFLRNDGGAEEPRPGANVIRIQPDGPLQLHADFCINNRRDASYRASLCRCGASRHKPYCDNSHLSSGFHDPGNATPVEAAPLRRRAPLNVTPLTNGPLLVVGPLTIVDARSEIVYRGEDTALCRCGHSGHKPFCDGTHDRVRFQS